MPLTACDHLVTDFARAIDRSRPPGPGEEIYTGVDLGTAYIVMAVVDGAGRPVAGAMRFAEVVRDGLVVDYLGAVDIVRELKASLETRLGRELLLAATAYPPGTNLSDVGAIRHVVEASGLEVVHMVDEPSAANMVLNIQDGAVVDIGGGTTGIAVLKGGRVVHVADEATGGAHFSLVLAGSRKISFIQAEAIKKDPEKQDEIFPAIKPVMEKVGSIINRHIARFGADAVYLAGGTSCLKNIEKIIEKQTGIRVYKPQNPFLVTPLGIAMAAAKEARKNADQGD